MNNQIISKAIKFNNKSFPEFVYENPLLDRSVTQALAKSFVRILGVSCQNHKVSSTLRLCVLENIRKLCQTGKEGHLKVDDNFLPKLTEFYNKNIGEADNSVNDSPECRLDAFLIRHMKDMEMRSSFESELNPEVIQALINLNSQGVYLDKLATDVIHWNMESDKHLNLAKDLWTNEDALEIFIGTKMIDDISIKMKSELEKMLLTTAYKMLQDKEFDSNQLSTDDDLNNLIKKCSVSADCFQMCIGILNSIFIATNFDLRLQQFIPHFVSQVKSLIQPQKFIVLYPMGLSSLVILLDQDLSVLEDPLKEKYISKSLGFLHQLHSESEHDFILMLSHYPQWFDVYFNQYSNE